MDHNTKLAVTMLALVGIVLVVAMLMSKSHHKCSDLGWTKSLKSLVGFTLASPQSPLQMKCKTSDGKVDQDKVNAAAMCTVDLIADKYSPAFFFSDDPKSPGNDDATMNQLITVCASKAGCAGN